MQSIVAINLKGFGNMSVGERISLLRKEQKISQGQLADTLGISRQAVSKWENGQSSPDTLNLIRLAEALNTEVEYLATGRKPTYDEPQIVLNIDKVVEKVVEKPVIKRRTRVVYKRNILEYMATGIICFILGILLGIIL